MAPKNRTVYPRHPDWTGDDADFASHHELVHEVSFPLGGPSSRKAYGRREARACAFCGGTAPTCTFRNEAHVFPAALGNRNLVSRDECDDCNSKYSRCDNELVRALDPQRMLSRSQRRRGESAPTLLGIDGKLSVTWDPATGHMRMNVDGEESSALRIDDERKTGTLTIQRPGYRPAQALRSILRSVWMISDDAFRGRHPELLKMIRDGIALPSQYAEFSVGGNQPRIARLRVFEKRTRVPGADVIIQFGYGNTTITFSPPAADGSYAPSLMPGIDVHGERPRVTGQIRLIPDDEPRAAEPFSVSFTFENRVDDAATSETRPAAASQETDATLAVEHEGQSVEVRTFVVPKQVRPGKVKFSITGGEFGAKLTMTVREGNNNDVTLTAPVHLTLQLHKVSLAPAKRTLQLLRLMSNTQAVVRLILDSKTLNGKMNGALNVCADAKIALVDALQAINDALQMDLRLPEKIDEEFVREVDHLATAIRDGQFVRRGVAHTFEFASTDDKTWMTELEKEGLTIKLESGMVFNIGNEAIDAGPVTMKMEGPRVADRRVVAAKDGKEYLVIELQADATTFVFDRWARGQVTA